MALSFINTSGNIISEDFCSQLLIEAKADYVKSKSFGEDVKKVDEDIATSFDLLRERWEEVRSKLLEDQFDTTQLRDRWIKPFLSMLGFSPVYNHHNLKNEAGLEYHIPYKGWDADDAPLIHMVHSSADLDSRDKNNRTHSNKSPHDLLQQFLNTSPHSWAILINGKKVRILRDFFHSITKGFIEFDIEGIFETANTEQFRILYRMMHSSRFIAQFEKQGQEEEQVQCWLEKFHTLSRETGVKVGDNLRKQVRLAIETLGNGFAENLNPDEYDDAKVKIFYSETLNIIYRLLFLLFAEQKGWLPVKNEVYARTYSINAMRERAERADYSHDNNEDLWEGLKVTFRLVTQGYTFPNGDSINAFGGQLFSDERIFHIKSPLKNKHLLKAVDALCFFTEKNLKNKINYATLAIDELGSVYESLLDYDPRLLKETTEINGRTCKRGEFVLDDRSTERKTTGSYYTDSRLVAQLIDSALVPVIENAIKDKPSDEEKRTALLELKVADIACGSGAFLIAALEKMGEYLSLIGKEEGEKPTEQELRHAKREVLQNCIYGVDLNPMALELAKFSLWITASMPNFPLSFLDHKLKCGNSLIGATPELIEKGIPVEAFNPVTLDDKKVCTELKKKVRKEIQGFARKDLGVQTGLEFKVTVIDSVEEAEQYLHILRSEQENAEEVEHLANEYEEVQKALRENTDWKLADTWTAAFFIQKDDVDKIYPTNVTLQNIKQGNSINEELEAEVLQLAKKYRFFHWHLEFPEVFENGGFDCILGNPPWEVWELKEKEFFSSFSKEIATANSGAKRKRLINNLKSTNPQLNQLYLFAKDSVERHGVYLNHSNNFNLTAHGKLNLYSIFAERARYAIASTGNFGLILPTGIATDDSTKLFFQNIVKDSLLISLYDFENKIGFFPEVDSRFKFCLLTVGGIKNSLNIDLAFFLHDSLELLNKSKHFSLKATDFKLLNPNTQNCPIFRNHKDAELTKKIYVENPVIHSESIDNNNWNTGFKVMFNMTTASHLFKEAQDFSNVSTINGNHFDKDGETFLPLYEGKMIDFFDHRSSEVIVTDNLVRAGQSEKVNNNSKIDVCFEPQPRFWIAKSEVEEKLRPNQDWVFAYKKVTSPTNERTFIGTVIPKSGLGDSLLLINLFGEKKQICFYLNLSTYIFDYVTRQKIGGVNLTFNYARQLPVVAQEKYTIKVLDYISKIALKLYYTSNNLEKFAIDLGYRGEPFTWDDEERFQLRCELDAIYGHLYGLSREEFDYILETFPIVKRKDIEKYGTYRTKDTILQLYDEMDWVKEELRITNQTITKNE